MNHDKDNSLSTSVPDQIAPYSDAVYQDDLANATERKLIDLALDGNEQAFTLLFNKHKKKIMSICLEFSNGDHVKADDYCQETFISAFMSLSQLKNKSRFTSQ